MFEEDPELSNEIEEQQQQAYRDRAEERRKQQIQIEEKEPGVAIIDGQEVKLKGLDTSILQPQNQKAKQDLIAQIRTNIQKAMQNLPKKTTHPMALKLEAMLRNPPAQHQQTTSASKRTKSGMDHLYCYEIDSFFGQRLPTLILKPHSNKDDEQVTLVQVKCDDTDFLSESLLETEYCSKKRLHTRHQFEQQPLFDVDEDIFEDAKPYTRAAPSAVAATGGAQGQEQKGEVMFDPSEYIRGTANVLSKEYYENLQKEVEEEQEAKRKRQEKHQKMLQDQDDYYVECYQPIGLTMDEEKERQEEVARLKLINPEFKEPEAFKTKFEKKKHHKNKDKNLNQELEKIEQNINKKKVKQ